MTIALLLTLIALQPPEIASEALEQIIVAGQRPNTRPFDLPIAFFRRHCHEPLCREREASAPDPSDAAWQPLGEEVREQLGLADPATTLIALTDHVRRHRLVLRIDQTGLPDGLHERRCALTVIGGDARRPGGSFQAADSTSLIAFARALTHNRIGRASGECADDLLRGDAARRGADPDGRHPHQCGRR